VTKFGLPIPYFLACDFIQVTHHSIRPRPVAGLPSAFCFLPTEF